MRPILLRLGGVPVHSYPTMLYLGVVLGIEAELYAGRAIGLDPTRLLAASLVLVVTALTGARLLFVIADWPTYRRHPRRIWRFSGGGAAMYGGLLLALPVSLPVTATLGIPLATFWDVASFTLLVGMVVTRAGCLLRGCCAGRPTRGWLGLHLPDDRGVRVRRIPAQILEAAWGLIVLAGAVVVWRHRPFAGAVICCTIGAYAAGRIVLESAREQHRRVVGPGAQRTISTGLVAASLAAFAVAWLR